MQSLLPFTKRLKKSKTFKIEAHSYIARVSTKFWLSPILQHVLQRFALCPAVAADTYGKSVSAQIIQDWMLPSGTASYDTINTRQSWIGICLKYVGDFLTKRVRIEIYRRRICLLNLPAG